MERESHAGSLFTTTSFAATTAAAANGASLVTTDAAVVATTLATTVGIVTTWTPFAADADAATGAIASIVNASTVFANATVADVYAGATIAVVYRNDFVPGEAGAMPLSRRHCARL